MSNPFKYLQDRRIAKEEERLCREEAIKRAETQREQLRQARLNAAGEFEDMIMDILKQLQKAAYPESELRAHRLYEGSSLAYSSYDGKPRWSIGYYGEHPVGELGHHTYWATQVLVTLAFDDRNLPSHFECWCQGRHPFGELWHGEESLKRESVRCGLSKAELVQTLKKLHP